MGWRWDEDGREAPSPHTSPDPAEVCSRDIIHEFPKNQENPFFSFISLFFPHKASPLLQDPMVFMNNNPPPVSGEAAGSQCIWVQGVLLLGDVWRSPFALAWMGDKYL